MKSIKTKILRSFLAVSILSLLVIGLFSEIVMFNLRNIAIHSNERIGNQVADSSERALTNQAVGDIAQLTEAKALIINEQLSQVAKSLELIANYVNHIYTNSDNFNPVLYNHAKDSPKGELTMQWVLSPGMKLEDVKDEVYLHGNMESIYNAVMKSNSGISSIYLTTSTGINSGYDAYAADKPAEFEGRYLPWYVNARDSGSLVISDTYQDAFERGLTMSMSIPCYDGDKRFVGVVGLDILIEDLNEMILQTIVGENGYAVLLKGEEKIISAPGLTDENAKDMSFFLGDMNNKILAQMTGYTEGIEKSVLHRNEKTEEVYILWAPIELTDWTLAFVLPVEDIVAPAIQVRKSIEELTETTAEEADRQILKTNIPLIMTFVIIIILVIYLTTRISRNITRPIAALTADVKAIGDGSLDYVSNIRTGDEIESLSRSFEHMTIELKEYIKDLSRVTADKERIATELNVATQIQASMLPCIFPPYPERKEFDLYAAMLPAKEVGGDFYDFFFVDDNTLALVVADVSGKGVPAALFMVIAKTLIKNNAGDGKKPDEVFESVNNILCENNDAGMFVTAFMGYLNVSTGEMTYVNAGHNPPVLRRKKDNELSFLDLHKTPPLAIFPNKKYLSQTMHLQPGDELLLYTDGVTEAFNSESEMYGTERLSDNLAMVEGKSVKGVVDGLRESICDFVVLEPQSDDITIFCCRYLGNEGRKLN